MRVYCVGCKNIGHASLSLATQHMPSILSCSNTHTMHAPPVCLPHTGIACPIPVPGTQISPVPDARAHAKAPGPPTTHPRLASTRTRAAATGCLRAARAAQAPQASQAARAHPRPRPPPQASHYGPARTNHTYVATFRLVVQPKGQKFDAIISFDGIICDTSVIWARRGSRDGRDHGRPPGSPSALGARGPDGREHGSRQLAPALPKTSLNEVFRRIQCAYTSPTRDALPSAHNTRTRNASARGRQPFGTALPSCGRIEDGRPPSRAWTHARACVEQHSAACTCMHSAHQSPGGRIKAPWPPSAAAHTAAAPHGANHPRGRPRRPPPATRAQAGHVLCQGLLACG